MDVVVQLEAEEASPPQDPAPTAATATVNELQQQSRLSWMMKKNIRMKKQDMLVNPVSTTMTVATVVAVTLSFHLRQQLT